MNEPHIRRANHENAERLVAMYRSAYRENRELGFPAKAETATEADIHDWLDVGRVFIAEIEDQESAQFEWTKRAPIGQKSADSVFTRIGRPAASAAPSSTTWRS